MSHNGKQKKGEQLADQPATEPLRIVSAPIETEAGLYFNGLTGTIGMAVYVGQGRRDLEGTEVMY